MVLKEEETGELDPIQSHLTELNVSSQPPLQIYQLGALLLEQGDLELLGLYTGVEVQVLLVDQMDVGLGELVEDHGVLVEQEQFARVE